MVHKWTDDMKRAAMADATKVCRLASRIAKLEVVLRNLYDASTYATAHDQNDATRLRDAQSEAFSALNGTEFEIG
jgi:hypothetical protein